MNRHNFGRTFLMSAVIGSLCGVAAAGSCLEQKVLAEVPQVHGAFGKAIGIDGETVVTASRQIVDGFGTRLGFVHILERTGAGWVEVKTLEDPLVGNQIGSVDLFGAAVAICGDVIAIGDPAEDLDCKADPSCNSGAVYVFRRHHGGTDNWGLAQTLFPDVPQEGRTFGARLAMTESVLVVGTAQDDTAGLAAGAVYVYEFVEDLWQPATMLLASDASELGFFGLSVAVAGDTIVAGAAGAAYVFERDLGSPGAWGQATRIVPDDSAPWQWFGYDIATDGETIVLGAYGDDEAGHDSGAAYVFERSGASWEQTQKLMAFDAQSNEGFGEAVGLGDELIIVGANFDRGGVGAAYAFQRPDGADFWSVSRKLVGGDDASQDFFGAPIAIDGVAAMVVAKGDDDLAPESGAVYSFDLAACVSCSADVTFDGAVNVQDLQALLADWSESGAPTDINLDGVVDVVDLVLLINNWGPCD